MRGNTWQRLVFTGFAFNGAAAIQVSKLTVRSEVLAGVVRPTLRRRVAWMLGQVRLGKLHARVLKRFSQVRQTLLKQLQCLRLGDLKLGCESMGGINQADTDLSQFRWINVNFEACLLHS